MARLDINNGHYFDQINADFEAVAEYAQAVERFLESEFHEHMELRPISPIVLAPNEYPNWTDDDLAGYEDDINQRLAENFNKAHTQHTFYFPNIQRATALTAAVTLYEFWVRRISLAVQKHLVYRNRWNGDLIRSGAKLEESRKCLKQNGFSKDNDGLSGNACESTAQIDNVICIRNFFAHQNGNYADAGAINKKQNNALAEATTKQHLSKYERWYCIERTYIDYSVELLHGGAVKFLNSALDFAKILDIEY